MSSPEVDHRRDRRSSSLNRNSGRSYSKGQYEENYRNYNNRSRSDKCQVIASNFPQEVSDHDLKDALHHEMGKFGDIANIHIRGRDQNRQAFTTFREDEAARELRRYCLERHCKVIAFQKTLHFDFEIDDRSEVRYHSSGNDRYNNRGGPYNNKSNFPNRSEGYRNDRYNNGNRGEDINNRDRFPEQGHDRFSNETHINPRATRTLFVGNLDHSISKEELMNTFEHWGAIDDIDIKRPPNGIPAYAFIKYLELEAASAAKSQMFGKEINGRPIKVGYGKTLPSTILWIGGLGQWCTTEMLNREFDRFGALRKINYVKGNRHAFIEFESLDASSAAHAEMRGFPLGGPDRKIKIDYAEPQRNRTVEERERSNEDRTDQINFSRGNNRFDSNKIESRGTYGRGRGKGTYDDQFYRKNDHDERDFDDRNNRRRTRSRSPMNNELKHNSVSDTKEESPNNRTRNDNSTVGRTRNNSINKDSNKPHNWNQSHDENNDMKPAESLVDVSKRFVVAWRGAFALKNSAFPVRMHLIGGNPELANFFLRGIGTGAGPALKVLSVTQRLRLDPPKLEEVSRRISQVGASGHCVLLALPTGEDIDLDSSFQRRPLKSLVTYFKKKEAAGVIILNTEGPSGKQEESGMLHAFPPCSFSQLELQKVAPNVTAEPSSEDHLVVIVVKGTSP